MHTHTHTYICMHCNSLDDHNLLYQKLIITPVKKELGLAFKGNQKMVVEALEVFIVCALLFVIADTHILSLSLSLQFPNFGGMGLAIKNCFLDVFPYLVLQALHYTKGKNCFRMSDRCHQASYLSCEPWLLSTRYL